MKKLFALSATLILISCTRPAVTIITSTNDQPWTTINDYKTGSTFPDSCLSFTIDTTRKLQQIDAFGGCLNELGWDALNLLDTATRNSILKEFFQPEVGFNFNYCRLPIGANDYARDWYSLNDSAGDFEMKHFNIERDKKILIPYIKSTIQYNPALRFWGSPWSPPTWMKFNNHYACATDEQYNDLKKNANGHEGTNMFIMQEKYLKAYALYFTKYIEAYSKEGINVDAVHVQNEFNSCQKFPSCTWKAEGLRNFIGTYLGPEFEKQNLKTQIWLGTIERGNVALIDTILQDSLCKKYIKGMGFQWAGRDAIAAAHTRYPDVKCMQSESECGDGSNDWKAAIHTWELIRHYFNSGANSYMYWNLILKKDGLSRWGWKQNALISVDTVSRKALYNPEFYLFKHLCHFVKPGAHLISVDHAKSDVLAFQNADGHVVILISNQTDKDETVRMNVEGRGIEAVIKAGSFSTIVF